MKSIFVALILTCLSTIALAGTPVVFQNWFSGSSDKRTSVSAMTVNNEDEILGEFCFYSSEKCTWEISIPVQCKEDAQFWILANAESAYLPLQLTCLGLNTNNSKYNYEFMNWKDIESLLKDRQNSVVAFAMPIGNTQFRVIRFSLLGVHEATKHAEQKFFASLPQKATEQVSDQTL